MTCSKSFVLLKLLCLIVSFNFGKALSDFILCCPVGEHLDSYLNCRAAHSNLTDGKMREFVSNEAGVPMDSITWSILEPGLKPLTQSHFPVADWSSPTKFCIDGENLFEFTQRRKINLNLCCPDGAMLNMETDECETVTGKFTLSIGVQPYNTDILRLSGYNQSSLTGAVNKTECSEADLLYLANGNLSCIRDDICFDEGETKFYVNSKDRVVKSIVGEIQEVFANVCLSLDTLGRSVARVCHKNPCLGRTCITKCCSKDEFLYIDPVDETNRGCRRGLQIPALPHLRIADLRDQPLPHITNAGERYGLPTCNHSVEYPAFFDDEDTSYEARPKRGFWLLPNASLAVATYLSTDAYSQHCYDQGWDNVTKVSRHVAYVCMPFATDQPPGSTDSGHSYYLAITMLISCVFLALTIIVHLLIPDLRNIHGITIVCNSFSMMMNFMLMAFMHMGISPPQKTLRCSLMGRVAHFFFLAGFAWLSVMGFDVYRAFSGSSTRGLSKHGLDKKTLAVYSLVAWGVPLLFSLFTLLMDMVDFPYYVVIPNFALNACWIYDSKAAVGAYLYAPVCFFILFNVACFAKLAMDLYTASRNSMRLSPTDEKRGRERLLAIVKLFVLMGISWIFEVLSWAVGGPKFLWILTDTVNILKSLLVFIIFVCRRRVLDLFGLRYPWIGQLLRKKFDWVPLSRVNTASGSNRAHKKSSTATSRYDQNTEVVRLSEHSRTQADTESTV